MLFLLCMTVPRAAHGITMVLAPLLLIAMLYFLYDAELQHNAASYRLSWYLLVGAVLLMEARVRFGLGTPRGVLFYAHLALAVPFFVALAVLAFAAQPFWLVIVADALLVLLAVLGGALLVRSVRMGQQIARSL